MTGGPSSSDVRQAALQLGYTPTKVGQGDDEHEVLAKRVGLHLFVVGRCGLLPGDRRWTNVFNDVSGRLVLFSSRELLAGVDAVEALQVLEGTAMTCVGSGYGPREGVSPSRLAELLDPARTWSGPGGLPRVMDVEMSHYSAMIEDGHAGEAPAQALRAELGAVVGANAQEIHAFDQLIRFQAFRVGRRRPGLKLEPGREGEPAGDAAPFDLGAGRREAGQGRSGGRPLLDIIPPPTWAKVTLLFCSLSLFFMKVGVEGALAFCLAAVGTVYTAFQLGWVGRRRAS